MRPMSILSMGTVLALGSAIPAAGATEVMKLTKECSQYTGETPSFVMISSAISSASCSIV